LKNSNTPVEKTVLEVTSNIEKTDKNGATYNQIGVKSLGFMNQVIGGVNRKIKTPSKSSRFNAWPKSYLEKDADGMPIGEAHFGHDLQAGDLVEGYFVQRAVEPYTIEKPEGDTIANSATVIVFGDATNEANIRQHFSRAGYILTGETEVSEEEEVASLVDAAGEE